jgi:uncharacterized damage-inducible protein DinB
VTGSFEVNSALLSAFTISNRISEYLIENVPAEAWGARPPEGKGRSIAAIAAHTHNVRLMWLKATGARTIPAKLDEVASVAATLQALGKSHAALLEVLDTALSRGQIRGFKPDAAAFCAYLIAHDAHHRGQIISLARRLGHAIPKGVAFGLWEWNTRSKEVR